MATTITNKTRAPISIPLGGRKRLHLGPGKSGEIAAKDAEQAGVKALVEAGTIEIQQGREQYGPRGTGPKGRAAHGHAASVGVRRSGDR